MEMRIIITQGEALRLAATLEYAIEHSKEANDNDASLLNNLRSLGGIVLNG